MLAVLARVEAAAAAAQGGAAGGAGAGAAGPMPKVASRSNCARRSEFSEEPSVLSGVVSETGAASDESGVTDGVLDFACAGGGGARRNSMGLEERASDKRAPSRDLSCFGGSSMTVPVGTTPRVRAAVVVDQRELDLTTLLEERKSSQSRLRK